MRVHTIRFASINFSQLNKSENLQFYSRERKHKGQLKARKEGGRKENKKGEGQKGETKEQAFIEHPL